LSAPAKRLTAAQIRTLEAEARTAREAAAKLQAERDDLQARLAAAEKAAKEAQAQVVSPLEVSLEALKTLFASVELPLPRKHSSEAFAEKLRSVIDERSQSAEEAKALREQVKSLDRRLAEIEKQSERASTDNEKVISQLIEENRRLAAQLEEVTADSRRFLEVAEGANAAVAAAREETDRQVRAELGAAVKQLESERGQLQKQIASLSSQLQSEGKLPVLTPDQVASVIGGLVEGLGSSMTGLNIRDGELKLKVGFASADTAGGFVIPTPDSAPDVRENLHEVTLRFDRAILK
jgi:chromosome segregation ATPase